MLKKHIVVIFIENGSGEFFVHQRLSTKKTFPDRYGIGAGGHIEEGEEILAAAKRELQEETSLTSEVVPLFSMDFETPEMNQTVYLHTTTTNGSEKTDESEWQWSGWLSKEAVDELAKENKLCPDTKELYIRYIKEYKSQR